MLKLAELALTMNPEEADKFNHKKFLDILEWLENNHGLCIVDWVAASQILVFLFGADEWKKHLQ